MPLKTTPRQVSEMFDQIAPSYDRINRIPSFGIDRYWRKALRKHLSPHSLTDAFTTFQ